MCKQPVLAFYCSRPLIYEGPHIGFQFHEGNSEFNSEERNSDSNSNSNDGNSNSIPIPPGLGKANSNSIPIPELDLELARQSNSGAELTPTLVYMLLKVVGHYDLRVLSISVMGVYQKKVYGHPLFDKWRYYRCPYLSNHSTDPDQIFSSC